jgi:hypothetical protein
MVSDASKEEALAKEAKQNIELHGSAGSSPAVSRSAVRAQSLSNQQACAETKL